MNEDAVPQEWGRGKLMAVIDDIVIELRILHDA